MIYGYARSRIMSGELNWANLANLTAFIEERSSNYSQPTDSEVIVSTSGFWGNLPGRFIEFDELNDRVVFKLAGSILFPGVTATSGITWTLLIGQRNQTAPVNDPAVYPIMSQQFIMPDSLSSETLVLGFPNNAVMFL